MVYWLGGFKQNTNKPYTYIIMTLYDFTSFKHGFCKKATFCVTGEENPCKKYDRGNRSSNISQTRLTHFAPIKHDAVRLGERYDLWKGKASLFFIMHIIFYDAAPYFKHSKLQIHCKAKEDDEKQEKPPKACLCTVPSSSKTVACGFVKLKPFLMHPHFQKWKRCYTLLFFTFFFTTNVYYYEFVNIIN